MEQSLNFDHGTKEFTIWPVNVGVKGAEPWVTKDQSISSKVHDIESFSTFLRSMGDEEVKVVSDLSRLVKSSVNIS